MHTFFRQRLSMGLLSTAFVLQGLCSGAVQAQQGEAQGNRPIRLTPATKRPAEPRRLNNTVMPRANPNVVPNQQSVATGMMQNPQAGPIPVTAANGRGLQQTAGPQSGASRSEIQQQLDEMYRKEGKQAPQMNYNSLPAVQAAQQAQGQGQGDDGEDEEDEGQQPTGPQQRSGNGSRAMPNNAVRGGGANGMIPILPQQQHQQSQQQQQQQQEYKEPNLLKRWFGPRKKPEQQQPQQVRPQQFPQQGQGMNRPQGGMPNQQQQAQQQLQQQQQMQQQMQQQQAQQQNTPQQPINNGPVVTPPQAPAAQVVRPPAQPGRATLSTENLQRTQPQQQAVRQQPAASRAPSVVVPVQTPAQPAQPAQENDTPAAEQPNGQKNAAAQEEDIPRLDEPAAEQDVRKEAPAAESKTAETPAAPAKKSPFENLEIYEPEQSKPAGEAQPSAGAPEKKEGATEGKEAAPQEQPAANPPVGTPAVDTPAAETPVKDAPAATPVAPPVGSEGRPVSVPPGKTSMQDLQTRPQAVLFLDGEDDEQREKYRMLAAFPEKTGFKGFCPTALRDERDLVRGRKSYQLTQHKHVYLFSSARALAAAQSNPEKYLPVADGQDVVLMKEGENVEGSVDAAAWYRGRLYLFASRKNLEMFAANPTLYTGTETVIRTQPAAAKHPLKTAEKPAEVSTEDEEETEDEAMEESASPKGRATPMRNQSPASMLNGPGGSGAKSKGSANPVPPPPAHEESEEPAMPGKKIRAAKFSDKNLPSDRKRTVLRVSVPAG